MSTSLLNGVIQYFEGFKLPIDLKQFYYLNRYEWGQRGFRSFRDGLKCIEHGLLHPALCSFIHAIEWALILGLKIRKKDIIGEERKNKNPFFLIQLIDKARKQEIISDKMYDRLTICHQSYRRWMAHHKTGKVTKKHLKDVINIFEELIDEFKDHNVLKKPEKTG